MNSIGIDTEKAALLSKKLNTLLANYQIFYQNLRGFHWNIQGPSFFELHAKFEELYNDANLKVDEIAERILTLESTPLHTFEDYIQSSSIKAVKDLVDSETTVNTTLENFATLISMEREIMQIASDADDEGTSALMSDYIREQEKTIWMLRSYIGKP